MDWSRKFEISVTLGNQITTVNWNSHGSHKTGTLQNGAAMVNIEKERINFVECGD